MGRNLTSLGSDRNNDRRRALRLEFLEPRWMMAGNYLGLVDATLANLTRSLRTEGGSINRADMIQILQTVQNEQDGVIDATDLRDLRTIVKNASKLNMPNYVKVLASDIVNGNLANAYYQDYRLGNLTAGCDAEKLELLINKWFYGEDLPYAGDYYYTTVAGALYSSTGPSHLDEKQGHMGTCYLISACGAIADKSQSAIRNMFIDNGDDTWTVRFFYNGKADYVTVNNELPFHLDADLGTYCLAFQGHGEDPANKNNVLWLSLVEKAYAQWNETGKTGRGMNYNYYAAIDSGWMGDVYQQILGFGAATYSKYVWGRDAKDAMLYALRRNEVVTIGTRSNANHETTGLYGNHAYNVLSYNYSTQQFTFYNPWGDSQDPSEDNQPNNLTWEQLKANTSRFAATYTTAKSIPSRMVLGMMLGSVITSPTAVVVSTVTTLDADRSNHSAVPTAPTAADMYFAHEHARYQRSLESQNRQNRWSLSDSGTPDESGESENLFGRIDAMIDSINWNLKELV